MPPDFDRYIGIPFTEKGRTRDGCDCWGLVRLVLQEQFDVELPSYVEDYETTADRQEIEQIIHRESAQRAAIVAPAFAQLGDVIILRIEGRPRHCGLVIAPGLMLHVLKGINAALERYDGMLWKHRVVGIYRPAVLVKAC